MQNDEAKESFLCLLFLSTFSPLLRFRSLKEMNQTEIEAPKVTQVLCIVPLSWVKISDEKENKMNTSKNVKRIFVYRSTVHMSWWRDTSTFFWDDIRSQTNKEKTMETRN
jgi:hypothetical protein